MLSPSSRARTMVAKRFIPFSCDLFAEHASLARRGHTETLQKCVWLRELDVVSVHAVNVQTLITIAAQFGSSYMWALFAPSVNSTTFDVRRPQVRFNTAHQSALLYVWTSLLYWKTSHHHTTVFVYVSSDLGQCRRTWCTLCTWRHAFSYDCFEQLEERSSRGDRTL